MQKALLYGSLTTIIIENMRLERDEKVSDMMEREMQQPVIEKEDTQEQEAPAATAEHKETGFVAVSIGEGE